MLRDLIEKNRSYRRFDESAPIPKEVLVELVELARLSPSAANRQPLRYILSTDPAMNARIFPTLSWAGYLQHWNGPAEGERPTGYIIIVNDTRLTSKVGCDHGIVAQSMLLGAVEKGFGGCMIGSINRQQLWEVLRIDDHYEIMLVVAIGKPAEEVIVENMETVDSVEYYRDADDRHHVPKRLLEELILQL